MPFHWSFHFLMDRKCVFFIVFVRDFLMINMDQGLEKWIYSDQEHADKLEQDIEKHSFSFLILVFSNCNNPNCLKVPWILHVYLLGNFQR